MGRTLLRSYSLTWMQGIKVAIRLVQSEEGLACLSSTLPLLGYKGVSHSLVFHCIVEKMLSLALAWIG